MPGAFTAFFMGSILLAKLEERIHKSSNEAAQIKKTFGCKPIFLSPEIRTWGLRFTCLHPRTRLVAGSFRGYRFNFLGLDHA